MRKDHANANTYGIDPSTIFIGGYSSGGVLAIHLAFIDVISDLPTSPINVLSHPRTTINTMDTDRQYLKHNDFQTNTIFIKT